VTVSIGVAEFPRDAVDANSLVEVADEALYLAKDGGRNQVVQAKRQRKQKLPSPTSMRAKKPVAATRELPPAKPAPAPKASTTKNGNGKKKKS
jgi:hypothetical protein